MTHEELEESVPLYAAGALDRIERQALEATYSRLRLLSQCAEGLSIRRPRSSRSVSVRPTLHAPSKPRSWPDGTRTIPAESGTERTGPAESGTGRMDEPPLSSCRPCPIVVTTLGLAWPAPDHGGGGYFAGMCRHNVPSTH